MARAAVVAAQRELAALYEAHRAALPQYMWEWEQDRWAEFIVALLSEGVGLPYGAARSMARVLTELNLVAPANLEGADASFLTEILVRQGCKRPVAKRATAALRKVAIGVQRRWGGHIQRLLRAHAQLMALDLRRMVDGAALPSGRLAKVAVLWLQNVANMPILLPDDAHVREFCRRHGISEMQLVGLADDAGLNLAVLDDVLSMAHGLPRGDGRNLSGGALETAKGNIKPRPTSKRVNAIVRQRPIRDTRRR
jgi:hypothetical protein